MSSQESSGAPGRSQEDPSSLGTGRRAQKLPGEHRSYQENTGAPRRAQELP